MASTGDTPISSGLSAEAVLATQTVVPSASLQVSNEMDKGAQSQQPCNTDSDSTNKTKLEGLESKTKHELQGPETKVQNIVMSEPKQIELKKVSSGNSSIDSEKKESVGPNPKKQEDKQELLGQKDAESKSVTITVSEPNKNAVLEEKYSSVKADNKKPINLSSKVAEINPVKVEKVVSEKAPTKEVGDLKDLTFMSSAKKLENQNDKNDKPIETIKTDGKKEILTLGNYPGAVNEASKADNVSSGEKSADKQNEVKGKETSKDEKETSSVDKKITPTKEVSVLKDPTLTSSAKKLENQNDKNDKPIETIKTDGKKEISILDKNPGAVNEASKADNDVSLGEKSADKQNDVKVKETSKDEKEMSSADKKITPTKEVSALKDPTLTSSAKKSENQKDKNDEPMKTIKTDGKKEASTLDKNPAPVNEGSKAVKYVSSGEISTDKQNEIKVKEASKDEKEMSPVDKKNHFIKRSWCPQGSNIELFCKETRKPK